MRQDLSTSTATLHPERLHRGLQRKMNCASRQNKASNDIVFVPAIGRSLANNEGKSEISISDIFDMRQSRRVSVRYYYRFGKKLDGEHSNRPPSLGCFLFPVPPENHGTNPRRKASLISPFRSNYYSNVMRPAS